MLEGCLNNLLKMYSSDTGQLTPYGTHLKSFLEICWSSVEMHWLHSRGQCAFLGKSLTNCLALQMKS